EKRPARSEAHSAHSDAPDRVPLCVFERISKHVQLALTHSQFLPHYAPLRNCPFYLSQESDRALAVDSEIRRNRHQCIYRRCRSCLFGNPGLELSCPVRKRIYIECRSQTPLAASLVKKPMIV